MNQRLQVGEQRAERGAHVGRAHRVTHDCRECVDANVVEQRPVRLVESHACRAESRRGLVTTKAVSNRKRGQAHTREQASERDEESAARCKQRTCRDARTAVDGRGQLAAEELPRRSDDAFPPLANVGERRADFLQLDVGRHELAASELTELGALAYVVSVARKPRVPRAGVPAKVDVRPAAAAGLAAGVVHAGHLDVGVEHDLEAERARVSGRADQALVGRRVRHRVEHRRAALVNVPRRLDLDVCRVRRGEPLQRGARRIARVVAEVVVERRLAVPPAQPALQRAGTGDEDDEHECAGDLITTL
eukprot:1848642-Prymnesium_polylepis.1